MTDAVDDPKAAVDLLIGLVICAGIIASYIPQHVQCLKLRSAKGLSLWTILICTISAVTITLASLLADWHRIQAAAVPQDDVSLQLRLLQTVNACMPTFQNLISVCFGIPFYAIYYFRFGSRDNTNTEQAVTNEDLTPRGGSKHRFEVVATAYTWMLAALTIAGSVWVILVFGSSPFLTDLMEFLGAIAALTNTVQWIPQIDTTWNAQHEGVLSLTSLLFAVVGDLILVAFWIKSNGESVWIYMTLAADAAMQLILIAMVLYFRRKRRRANVTADDQVDNGLSTPLLSSTSNEGSHRDIEQVEEEGTILDMEAAENVPE